jgi:XTP/dITP diphosphohydrolase
MNLLKLLIATTNPGKFREIRSLLQEDDSPFELLSLADLGIDTPYPETGKTFQENAEGKSIFYSRLAPDILTVGEDSGLTVDALGGRPGIHSARFAGPEAANERNIEKLLEDMRSHADRRAAFMAVLALSKNGRLIKSFRGTVEGILLKEKKGSGGFGYDPVFYYPPRKKTFAELPIEEKNRISHRSQAFKKLKEFLLNSI